MGIVKECTAKIAKSCFVIFEILLPDDFIQWWSSLICSRVVEQSIMSEPCVIFF